MNKKRSYIILILVMGILMMSACGSKEVSDKEVDELEKEMLDIIEEEDTEDIKKDFEILMASEDKTIEDITNYLDKYISIVSKKEAEEMVLEFEKHMIGNVDKASQELKALDKTDEILEVLGDDTVLSEEKIESLESGEIKTIMEKLTKSGYKVFKDGEDLYLSVDYNRFSKYDDFISDNFKGYLNIKSREANAPVWINDGLNVSYEELSTRLIEIEDYLTKYEEPYDYESMLRSYRSNLLIYLRGDNIRYKEEMANEDLNKELLNSYEKVVKNKEGTLSYIIRDYLKVLEDNGKKINKEVYDKILPLVNEALGIIEENNRKLKI